MFLVSFHETFIAERESPASLEIGFRTAFGPATGVERGRSCGRRDGDEMSGKELGEGNTQEAHHCQGCGCVQTEAVPSVELVRDLIEEHIPQELEKLRFYLAPYRRLEQVFPGFGGINYTYDVSEGDIPMQVRFFLYRGDEAALRLEWTLLGYEFRLVYDSWSRSSGRDARPYGDQSERTPIDDLTETPIMRQAAVHLADVVLPDAIRDFRRDLTARMRDRFSPDVARGRISDTHHAVNMLIRAIRAHEEQREYIFALRGFLKDAIDGFSATRGHIKSKEVERLRIELEERFKELDSVRGLTRRMLSFT